MIRLEHIIGKRPLLSNEGLSKLTVLARTQHVEFFMHDMRKIMENIEISFKFIDIKLNQLTVNNNIHRYLTRLAILDISVKLSSAVEEVPRIQNLFIVVFLSYCALSYFCFYCSI